MKSEQHFRVTYDGEALSTHQMDVRDLAPALLAISDLLENANRVLNDGRAQVNVKVRGSFKTGCFAIDFSIVQSLGSQLKELFTSNEATAIANAAQIIGALGMGALGAQKGLVFVLKWLRGRTVTKVIELGDRVEVHAGDESILVEREVLALLSDYDTRKSLEETTVPLRRDGVDVVAFGSDDEIFDSIKNSEAPWFVVPDLADEQLDDAEYEATLQIARIEFNEDNKWRFTDGEASFYAAILDDDFLNRINKNEEAFTKGDIIKARIRKSQRLSGNQVKSDYFILRVLDHKGGARQIRLPLE